MNKMLVVLAVVLVAAIGITAVVLPSGETEEELPDVSDTLGQVYGNADGDFDIDKQDKRIIEAIIAEEKAFEDFPFADTNHDGNVTQEDADLVQKYLDHETMVLYAVDDDKKVIPVKYPVDRLMALTGTAMSTLVTALHVEDKLVAISCSDYLDPVRDAGIKKLIDSGAVKRTSLNGTASDMDIISDVKPQLLITENSPMYDLDSDENIKVLNAWGIDVLRLECKSPSEQMATMATLGILLDATEDAQEYGDFVDGILEGIKEKLGEKFGERKVMVKSKHGFSAEMSSYWEMIIAAGGHNLISEPGQFSKPYHPNDQWIFEPQYEAEVYAFGMGSSYVGDAFTPEEISQMDPFKLTKTWKEGKVYMFDHNLPPLIRIAYFAEAFNSDVFGEGWGDKIHQEYIDKFFDDSLDYTVEKGRFFLQLNA